MIIEIFWLDFVKSTGRQFDSTFGQEFGSRSVTSCRLVTRALNSNEVGKEWIICFKEGSTSQEGKFVVEKI